MYRVVTPFYSFLYFFLKKINKVREDHLSLATLSTLDKSALFYWNGRQPLYFCIIIIMSKYVYQIQGALENSQGVLLGLRVLVCDKDNFESVDVPVEVLDSDTAKYLQFRFSITAETTNISALPVEIQNRIRTPLGRWLDHWVCKNFYGHNSNHKDTNA